MGMVLCYIFFTDCATFLKDKKKIFSSTTAKCNILVVMVSQRILFNFLPFIPLIRKVKTRTASNYLYA